MNVKYLVLRLLRHFMPESLARLLLKRRWIIRPGLETSDPHTAVEQYISALCIYNKSIHGKRILIFGYGGRFAVGVELLRKGAAHVILSDHFVLLDKERNLGLLPEYAEYLVVDKDGVKPRPEFITLLHGDICDEKIQFQISEVDFVLSTSVYEHLVDVNGITCALANLMAPEGAHLHFVDLRDHYFKYPFEMLTFSDRVWMNFLNPSSNLNRFRLPDYRRVFENWFQKVDINILERQEPEFFAARSRIRQEFRSGDAAVDSATLISIFSQNPEKKQL